MTTLPSDIDRAFHADFRRFLAGPCGATLHRLLDEREAKVVQDAGELACARADEPQDVLSQHIIPHAREYAAIQYARDFLSAVLTAATQEPRR